MDNEYKRRVKKQIEDSINRPDSEAWSDTVNSAKETVKRLPSILRPEAAAVDKLAPIGIPKEQVRVEERLSKTLGDYRKLKEQLSQDPTSMQALDGDYGSYKQQMPQLDLEAREAALRRLIEKYQRPQMPMKK